MKKMRDLINLVESTNPTLYHGSRRELQQGLELTSQKINHDDLESQAVESMFEVFRPNNKRSRNACIYMLAEPSIDAIEKIGGYADYIYEVETIAQVFKYDVSWWGQVFGYAYDYMDGSPADRTVILKQVQPLIEAYWEGLASKSPKWEYLSEKAVVVKLVGGYRC